MTLIDTAYLFAFFVGAIGLTMIVTAALGKATKWRSNAMAIAGGGLAVPFAITALVVYVRLGTPDGPPPNDAKGTAVFFLIGMAAIALPMTFATSMFLTSRRSRR